jgi:hypothetical protein
MEMPSYRAVGHGKRRCTCIARDLLVFSAIVPMLIALLVTTIGARRVWREPRLAAFSSVQAARSTQLQAQQLGQDPTDDLLALATTEASEGEDSDGSQSDDRSGDQDDGGDRDDMTVRQLEPIRGASFCAWLWHETPELSGVIHSPEPRPARSV